MRSLLLRKPFHPGSQVLRAPVLAGKRALRLKEHRKPPFLNLVPKYRLFSADSTLQKHNMASKREVDASFAYKPMVLDMNREWWREIIIYEIYVQSFQDSNGDGIGDLRGIIQRLDYLKDLGVDMLWLTPIYESPLEDQGYDISDFKAINPMYGTMKDWEYLIAEVHRRGMKLMMDMVFNHTSSQVFNSAHALDTCQIVC